MAPPEERKKSRRQVGKTTSPQVSNRFAIGEPALYGRASGPRRYEEIGVAAERPSCDPFIRRLPENWFRYSLGLSCTKRRK